MCGCGLWLVTVWCVGGKCDVWVGSGMIMMYVDDSTTMWVVVGQVMCGW